MMYIQAMRLVALFKTHLSISILAFALSLAPPTAIAADDFSPKPTSEQPTPSQKENKDELRAEEIFAEAVLSVRGLLADADMVQLRRHLPYARAVMVFPSLLSGGFFIGAKGGTGLLIARNGDGWSDGGFVHLRGVSFGLQIGAEKSEAMFLIMTEKGLQSVSTANFKLGADVSVAVGWVGIGASAATTASATDIYSFAKSAGAFVGVSFDGVYMGENIDLNRAFYGDGLSDEMLTNQALTSHRGGERSAPLVKALKHY